MRRSHSPVVLLSVLAAFAVAQPIESALACTLEPAQVHEADPSLSLIDSVAPERPHVLSAAVSRRSGLTCGAEKCVANSCGDSAMLAIELGPTLDDQTPPDRIGYRFELVNGVLPDSLLGQIGIGLMAHTRFFLALGFDEVISLDATLQAVAVDDAGNESEPSAPFTVSFDGCTLAAVGSECEGDFNPDTMLGGSSIDSDVFETADREVFETAAAPRASGCALGARSSRSSAGGMALATLGVLLALGARRRR
jgi:hypothetical protein